MEVSLSGLSKDEATKVALELLGLVQMNWPQNVGAKYELSLESMTNLKEWLHGEYLNILYKKLVVQPTDSQSAGSGGTAVVESRRACMKRPAKRPAAK